MSVLIFADGVSYGPPANVGVAYQKMNVRFLFLPCILDSYIYKTMQKETEKEERKK